MYNSFIQTITVATIKTATEVEKAAAGQMQLLLLFVFVLAAFLGFELIQKVPSQLHTPLMSGSNAISGITIVGAILAVRTDGEIGKWIGLLALILATVNVVGGYMVTDRMLGMFKGKDQKKK